MQTITIIGFDIAKSVFQVHGVDAAGEVVTTASVIHQTMNWHDMTFEQIARPMARTWAPST